MAIIKSILDTDLYKLTTSYAYSKLFPRAYGEFEFVDRDDRDYRRYDRDDRNWRNVNGSYQQLPPGLQKNVARGKAVPPGWAKKLDDRYYSTTVRNGQSVYILNDDVYRNARIIGYPRDGVVRVNVDNRTVEILEATRAILNVLN